MNVNPKNKFIFWDFFSKITYFLTKIKRYYSKNPALTKAGLRGTIKR